IFHASREMPTSEIDIRSTPLEDLYVALVTFNPSGDVAAFKVFVGPFTWWFWFGGVVLVLGTLICLWPTRESLSALRLHPDEFGRPAPPRPASSALARTVVGSSVVALCFLPLVVWTVESETMWGSALRYERMISVEDASAGS